MLRLGNNSTSLRRDLYNDLSFVKRIFLKFRNNERCYWITVRIETPVNRRFWAKVDLVVTIKGNTRHRSGH